MGMFTDWLRKYTGAAPKKRDAYAATYGNGGGNGAGFAGAAVNRLTASMASWSGSVNMDLDGGGISILRARARQLAQGNEHGKRFLSMAATNIVGRSGPMLQVRAMQAQRDPNKKPALDKAANDAIEVHWARWCKKADITGKMTFAHLLRVAVKAMARDGEALIRIVRDRGLPYGMALQLLEADRLDHELNMVLKNRSIRQGVEIDSRGKPVAYWIRTKHPGEQYGAARSDMERIPAGDIIHLFLQERPEQVRGYTWFHAIILRATQLGGFNDAAVLAARIGASKIAALERTEEAPDLTATMADGNAPTGGISMNVEAGEMFELPAGYKLNSWNPDYPHQNYESFSKTALEGISAGLDVANHNLTGNMSGVNYSSARIAELSEREVWMILQDATIFQAVEPVYQDWLAISLLRGDITFEISGKSLPADKLAKFANASRFQGRRWRWVDPGKELEAFAKAVELGVTSRTRIAAEQGDDLEDVLDELEQEQELMKAKGLNPTPNQPPAAAPAPDPAQAPEVLAAKAMADGNVRAAEATARARAAEPPVPAVAPVIHINTTLPEQRHEIHNHLPEQSVTVEATMPEPHVTVEAIMPEQRSADAPAITVINQVQPADVVVNNNHPKRAVQTVVRNAADEITSTVTTYE